MPTVEKVLNDLQNARASNRTLNQKRWTLSPNTPGERSVIAEYQADRPIFLRPHKELHLAFIAHEEFTTNATGGDSETFTLSHDLLNSDATPDNFVLYENGTEVAPDSVDYANDSFTYTDDGTSNDLDAFYATGTQAEVEIRKRAPSNVQQAVLTDDAGLLMRRDIAKDPVTLDYEGDLLKGVVPEKWKVEVVIDAPFQVTWEDDGNAGAKATNALLQIPTRESADKIPGLRSVARQHASSRGA